MSKITTRGYKVFNPDFTCKGFKFEVGKDYKIDEPIKICAVGFHFCLKAAHCFAYYSFDSNNIVCEVEALGEIAIHDSDSKICTNHIKILRQLTWQEVLQVANDGKDNTGHSNTGYRNTGDRNTGDRNTGDRNTGDRNTGGWNTGDRNTGDRNTGGWNTGGWNTGDRNTGGWNTGDRNTGYSNTGYSNTGGWNTGGWNTGDSNTGGWNTGYRNTGDRNTGDRNTGDRNTGGWNTGDRNTGGWNTGDRNTGDRNTGGWNTGGWNTGDRNTGYSNTGDRNTGVFCTGEKTMRFFNKDSNWTEEKFLNSPAYSLLQRIDTKLWVPLSKMTEQEQADNKGCKLNDGFYRDMPFKEAFSNAWGNWSEENRKAFTSLPNFDKKIFFSITSVKIK